MSSYGFSAVEVLLDEPLPEREQAPCENNGSVALGQPRTICQRRSKSDSSTAVASEAPGYACRSSTIAMSTETRATGAAGYADTRGGDS